MEDYEPDDYESEEYEPGDALESDAEEVSYEDYDELDEVGTVYNDRETLEEVNYQIDNANGDRLIELINEKINIFENTEPLAKEDYDRMLEEIDYLIDKEQEKGYPNEKTIEVLRKKQKQYEKYEKKKETGKEYVEKARNEERAVLEEVDEYKEKDALGALLLKLEEIADMDYLKNSDYLKILDEIEEIKKTEDVSDYLELLDNHVKKIKLKMKLNNQDYLLDLSSNWNERADYATRAVEAKKTYETGKYQLPVNIMFNKPSDLGDLMGDAKDVQKDDYSGVIGYIPGDLYMDRVIRQYDFPQVTADATVDEFQRFRRVHEISPERNVVAKRSPRRSIKKSPIREIKKTKQVQQILRIPVDAAQYGQMVNIGNEILKLDPSDKRLGELRRKMEVLKQSITEVKEDRNNNVYPVPIKMINGIPCYANSQLNHLYSLYTRNILSDYLMGVEAIYSNYRVGNLKECEEEIPPRQCAVVFANGVRCTKNACKNQEVCKLHSFPVMEYLHKTKCSIPGCPNYAVRDLLCQRHQPKLDHSEYLGVGHTMFIGNTEKCSICNKNAIYFEKDGKEGKLYCIDHGYTRKVRKIPLCMVSGCQNISKYYIRNMPMAPDEAYCDDHYREMKIIGFTGNPPWTHEESNIVPRYSKYYTEQEFRDKFGHTYRVRRGVGKVIYLNRSSCRELSKDFCLGKCSWNEGKNVCDTYFQNKNVWEPKNPQWAKMVKYAISELSWIVKIAPVNSNIYKRVRDYYEEFIKEKMSNMLGPIRQEKVLRRQSYTNVSPSNPSEIGLDNLILEYVEFDEDALRMMENPYRAYKNKNSENIIYPIDVVKHIKYISDKIRVAKNIYDEFFNIIVNMNKMPTKKLRVTARDVFEYMGDSNFQYVSYPFGTYQKQEYRYGNITSMYLHSGCQYKNYGEESLFSSTDDNKNINYYIIGEKIDDDESGGRREVEIKRKKALEYIKQIENPNIKRELMIKANELLNKEKTLSFLPISTMGARRLALILAVNLEEVRPCLSVSSGDIRNGPVITKDDVEHFFMYSVKRMPENPKIKEVLVELLRKSLNSDEHDTMIGRLRVEFEKPFKEGKKKVKVTLPFNIYNYYMHFLEEYKSAPNKTLWEKFLDPYDYVEPSRKMKYQESFVKFNEYLERIGVQSLRISNENYLSREIKHINIKVTDKIKTKTKRPNVLRRQSFLVSTS